jgi:hypothetical protein
MGVSTLEVGYTSATTGRGDHEVRKGACGGVGKERYHIYWVDFFCRPYLKLKIRRGFQGPTLFPERCYFSFKHRKWMTSNFE